jgi:hypothetical protein
MPLFYVRMKVSDIMSLKEPTKPKKKTKKKLYIF